MVHGLSLHFYLLIFFVWVIIGSVLRIKKSGQQSTKEIIFGIPNMVATKLMTSCMKMRWSRNTGKILMLMFFSMREKTKKIRAWEDLLPWDLVYIKSRKWYKACTTITLWWKPSSSTPVLLKNSKEYFSDLLPHIPQILSRAVPLVFDEEQ